MEVIPTFEAFNIRTVVVGNLGESVSALDVVNDRFPTGSGCGRGRGILGTNNQRFAHMQCVIPRKVIPHAELVNRGVVFESDPEKSIAPID